MADEKQEKEKKTQQTDTSSLAAEPAGEGELLRKKIDEILKTSSSLKDQLLRKAAEFENYKRRAEAEYESLVRNANEGLILSLLPILNDFVRSLKPDLEPKDFDAFFKGVELIHNKLSKTLEQQGLVPFESVGKAFDVDYHDALLQVPRSDVPPHTVIQEVERGYLLNDKVIRHAKVVVSSEAEHPAEVDKVPEKGRSKETDA